MPEVKKRNFKRRDVAAANILEWAVAQNRQQFLVIVAIVIVAIGILTALAVNLRNGPDLSQWQQGPEVYAKIMADRKDTSPVVALYLYKDDCDDCRAFERHALVNPQVKQFLTSYDLVRVDESADASSSAIADIYKPDRYPAFFILRPPPKPWRQIRLRDHRHDWLSIPAFLDACDRAVTWPDQSKGGVMDTDDSSF